MLALFIISSTAPFSGRSFRVAKFIAQILKPGNISNNGCHYMKTHELEKINKDISKFAQKREWVNFIL
jgi:hypothetical protein